MCRCHISTLSLIVPDRQSFKIDFQSVNCASRYVSCLRYLTRCVLEWGKKLFIQLTLVDPVISNDVRDEILMLLGG